MRLCASIHLVPSLLRRHPLSGIVLLILTLALLFTVVQFAYDQLQDPVFILFSDEELRPSANTTPYNLDEIYEFD